MAVTTKKTTLAKKPAPTKTAQVANKIHEIGERLRKEVKTRVTGSSKEAKTRTVDIALTLVKVQRAALDSVFSALNQVQKRSDKLIKEHVEDADWLPPEGKDIVHQWSRALNDGRNEFKKTVDKSYDLLRDYFERVRKEQKGGVAKTAAVKKTVPAKKTGPVKKKAKAAPAARKPVATGPAKPTM